MASGRWFMSVCSRSRSSARAISAALRSRLIPKEGSDESHPDGLAITTDVALVQRVRRKLAGKRPTLLSEIIFQIVRMGNVLERCAQQFVFGVAKHHAKGMIAQEKRSIWVDQCHSDRRVLKCRAKARLAGRPGVLRHLSLRDVQVHALPGNELSCLIVHRDALIADPDVAAITACYAMLTAEGCTEGITETRRLNHTGTIIGMDKIEPRLAASLLQRLVRRYPGQCFELRTEIRGSLLLVISERVEHRREVLDQ